MDLRGDLRSLRSIVEGATNRWLTLLGTAGSPEAEVPGLAWDAGELTAHVISVVESFDRYVSRQEGPGRPYDALAAYNQARLEAVAERRPVEAAPRLKAAMDGFLATTRLSQPSDPFPWFDDQELDVVTAHAILAAELLVHGRDLARARGVSWPIPAPEARHVVVGLLAAVPSSVDPVRAAREDFTARIRLRSGPTFALVVEGGEVEVVDGGRKADVTLWTAPTTFLLASFGRVSPLRAALAGKALAWGRRPWLAFSLPGLFRT